MKNHLQAIVDSWHLHPFIDHFTIALLVAALLIDIAASILPLRIWLRNMALVLMIAGAVSAAGSWYTGHLEYRHVAALLGPVGSPGRALLGRHADLGHALMLAFAVLAIWRILIQALSFMRHTRQVYLALTIIAVGALLYQGYLGGEMVFGFGAGTSLLAQQGAPHPSATAFPSSIVPAIPSSIPTVYVPTAMPTEAPTLAPSAAPSAALGAKASASPTAPIPSAAATL